MSNKLMRLAGCGIKSAWPIFKIETSIYQSKANLDVKILVGKITVFKLLERTFHENEKPAFKYG